MLNSSLIRKEVLGDELGVQVYILVLQSNSAVINSTVVIAVAHYDSDTSYIHAMNKRKRQLKLEPQQPGLVVLIGLGDSAVKDFFRIRMFVPSHCTI